MPPSSVGVAATHAERGRASAMPRPCSVPMPAPPGLTNRIHYANLPLACAPTKRDDVPRGGIIVRRLIGLASLLTLLMAGIALAATPEVVLNAPDVDEFRSSASDGYLVWSANSEAKPNRSHSYVRADGGQPVRINPTGTQSFGATIDGTTIVYEEHSHGPRGSDLYFTDAVTPDRQPPPDGVNTRADELRPTLSGDHLLFTRSNFNRVGIRRAWTRVILVDVTTGDQMVLRERSVLRTYLVSGQVNGDWVTFESCRVRDFTFSNCNVFRYEISTADLTKVPNPGQQQYGGGVSDDGTVYVTRTGIRSHWDCGRHAKIVRVPLSGQEQVIARLPDGKDAFTAFAFDEPGGSTTLYFDRFSCRNGSSGIYRIPDADTAGP